MAKNVYSFPMLAVFLAVCLVCGTPAGAGEQDNDADYIIGDIDTLSADFDLNVSVSTNTGWSDNGVPVVDGVCTFTVSRSAAGSDAETFYDVSLFEEGRFSKMYKGRSLPFTLKRNFRGIMDGTYSITFVARDEDGKTGKGAITIQVNH